MERGVIVSIQILPSDWNETEFQPVNVSEFSLFKVDTGIQGYIMGKSVCGCYSLTVNPKDVDFADRLIDFIRYENAHGRCVYILSPDYDVSEILRQHEPVEGLRKTDLPYATHSTTLTAYGSIVREGCLKSAAHLRREGIAQKAIGLFPLGEPDDYLDYVMFAPMDGWGSAIEIVVNSWLRGEVCYDPQAPYTPQARMYFDAHKIITDGLAVRDGVHSLKVYDSLLLKDYLLLTVFEKDVMLPAASDYWTPTNFTDQANEFFLKYIKNREVSK